MAESNGRARYNGMFAVRKEAGYTSNDVVARLRGILHMRRIGHGGTLDPDAEGVLPVCLGTGTRLVDLIAERDKEYVALLRLGVTTDTQDLSAGARRLATVSDALVRSEVTEEKLLAALRSFTGEYDQIPPMYSAIKQGGKRLYELAREGKTVARPARRVYIYELELLSMTLPEARIRVRCGKGTYIRTLCEDIGRRLGVGGAMQHLVRTRVGIFALEDAFTLSEVEELERTGRMQEIVRSPEFFFPEAAQMTVLPEHDFRLRNGNVLTAGQTDADRAALERAALHGIRMYFSDGTFAGIYRMDGELLRSEKMFLVQ